MLIKFSCELFVNSERRGFSPHALPNKGVEIDLTI